VAGQDAVQLITGLDVEPWREKQASALSGKQNQADKEDHGLISVGKRTSPLTQIR